MVARDTAAAYVAHEAFSQEMDSKILLGNFLYFVFYLAAGLSLQLRMPSPDLGDRRFIDQTRHVGV